MQVPKDLKYTEEHEWIRVDGNIATIGITDHAQGELGDIVYVEIDTEGQELAQGDVFGSVEAVKAVSDLYMPLSGTITELNTPIIGDDGEGEIVNRSPYEEGWMIKIEISDMAEIEKLLDAEAYEKLTSA